MALSNSTIQTVYQNVLDFLPKAEDHMRATKRRKRKSDDLNLKTAEQFCTEILEKRKLFEDKELYERDGKFQVYINDNLDNFNIDTIVKIIPRLDEIFKREDERDTVLFLFSKESDSIDIQNRKIFRDNLYERVILKKKELRNKIKNKAKKAKKTKKTSSEVSEETTSSTEETGEKVSRPQTTISTEPTLLEPTLDSTIPVEVGDSWDSNIVPEDVLNSWEDAVFPDEPVKPVVQKKVANKTALKITDDKEKNIETKVIILQPPMNDVDKIMNDAIKSIPTDLKYISLFKNEAKTSSLNLKIDSHITDGMKETLRRLLKKTVGDTYILGPVYKQNDKGVNYCQIGITGTISMIGNVIETAEQAIVREICEEVGVVPDVRQLKAIHILATKIKEFTGYTISINNCIPFPSALSKFSANIRDVRGKKVGCFVYGSESEILNYLDSSVSYKLPSPDNIIGLMAILITAEVKKWINM